LEGNKVDHWPYELLRLAGFDLRLDGDRLMVSPAEDVDDSTRAYIKANKASLVASCQRIAEMGAAFRAWNAAVVGEQVVVVAPGPKSKRAKQAERARSETLFLSGGDAA
jgi:hypothetical protein